MPASTRSKTATVRAGAGRRFAPPTGRATTGTRRLPASAGRGAARTRRPAASRRTGTPTPVLGLSAALGRRRQPKKSGLSKALTGLMSAGAAKKAAPSSKKGKSGGVAMLAAGAGLAYKNRDKLAGLLKRRRGSRDAPLTNPSPAPMASAGDRA